MTAYKQSESIQWLNSQYANNSTNDGATYNVFQLPVEAPNFGGRTLINSSAHSIASPFGWHDTDGQSGPEYTDTRGKDRKSTRLNSSHVAISYAVFCLQKKKS